MPRNIMHNNKPLKNQADDFFSMDQFDISTLGQFLTSYGQKGDNNLFLVEPFPTTQQLVLSGLKNQGSLGAGETIMANICFKKWLWDLTCAEIKHIHSNIGIFSADVFQSYCTKKHQ